MAADLEEEAEEAAERVEEPAELASSPLGLPGPALPPRFKPKEPAGFLGCCGDYTQVCSATAPVKTFRSNAVRLDAAP